MTRSTFFATLFAPFAALLPLRAAAPRKGGPRGASSFPAGGNGWIIQHIWKNTISGEIEKLVDLAPGNSDEARRSQFYQISEKTLGAYWPGFPEWVCVDVSLLLTAEGPAGPRGKVFFTRIILRDRYYAEPLVGNREYGSSRVTGIQRNIIMVPYHETYIISELRL